jgi:hypothetical protein
MLAPSVTASAVLALATALSGQVPAGTCIATLGPTTLSRTTIVFVDPLTTRTTSVTDPLQFLGGALRTAIASPAGGDLLVGMAGTLSGPDVLVRGRLAGSQVTGAATFATGFTGAITSVVEMRGNGFAVGTSAGLFRVAPAGGVAQAIVAGPQGYECRDVALAGNALAALLADRLTGATSILTMPLTGGNPTVRPVAVTRSRSIGFHESAMSFALGTDGGEVWAVDPQTLVPKLVVATGRGPVRSFAFATNHKYFLFGTSGAVQILEGANVGPPIPLAAGADVLDLAWQPFVSTFTVEGSGCAGLAGIPQIGSFGGEPFPGNGSFGVGIAGASPQRPAMLGLGIDRVSLDLSVLGAPGCIAWTNPLVSWVHGTGPLGRVLAPLPIPPDAGIAGGGVSVQWFVLEPANVLGLVTTARGRIEF